MNTHKKSASESSETKTSFFDWNWSETIKKCGKTSLLAAFNRLQQKSGRSKSARRHLNYLIVNHITNV